MPHWPEWQTEIAGVDLDLALGSIKTIFAKY